MYDLIVIGGGPAGLTATIYALHKHLNVLLVAPEVGGKTNYHLQLPDMEHHWLIDGEQVISQFVKEIEHRPPERVNETVTTVQSIDGGYEVQLHNGQTHSARTLIIATGAQAQRLNVPGEKDYGMRGLSYSALSYASLFADRTVVVVGDGGLALRATAELARIARHVTLVAPTHGELASPLGQRLQTLNNVTLLKGQFVDRVEGDTYARTLVITQPNGTETELHADAFFVELGLHPNSELVKGLVALDAQGRIEIDTRNRTSAPGLFAAGDVTNVYAEQVLVAIGEGAKAALSAYDYLLTQPVDEPVPEAEWR